MKVFQAGTCSVVKKSLYDCTGGVIAHRLSRDKLNQRRNYVSSRLLSIAIERILRVLTHIMPFRFSSDEESALNVKWSTSVEIPSSDWKIDGCC
jgi:hypothetical protein